MTPVIDMGDQNAWDDSMLINSWDNAVTEYKKYHSIYKSGKRLEDILTEEELEGLRGDHGDLIEKAETTGRSLVSSAAEPAHADMTHADSTEETKICQQQQNRTPSATDSALHTQDPMVSMPQALLGSVQDENLKNIMISWYYAGYYTGLYTGQQQVSKNSAPNQ